MSGGGYPENWPEARLEVKKRAGWRCERCGHGLDGSKRRVACTHHCTHPDDGKQRILTVHHLDGNKWNSAWWNLAALCQVCHLHIQGKVKLERAFIFEHSPWFKIHAAGWYAWKYEGRMIAREEAAERMDELLAYERLA